MKRLAHFAAVLLILLAASALADDGVLMKKNIPMTPELESDHAIIKMMRFYVPAQSSDGTLLRDTDDGGIVYLFKDDLYPSMTREFARPLVSFYTDGHVELVETAGGFDGHGERDIFAAASFDDGATWKRVNLSKSADQSSIMIGGAPYPGDVVTMFTAGDSNKVLAVWASRLCQSGNPTYGIDPDTEGTALIDEAINNPLVELPEECTDGVDTTPCLYLDDLFGVAGSQGSSDFTDEGFPEVGEVPYSCLWAARGTVEPVSIDAEGGTVYDPTGATDQHGIIWRVPERLTSGRRDVYRIEAAAVAGAGFVVTWQEDPGGLRPGLGEGPGEGWSGAIAHHKTDIWYSYIHWDAFDLVDDNTDGLGLYGDPISLADYFATSSETPKPGVPMSIPIRLTDNNKCSDGLIDPDTGETLNAPYCHTDFDGNGTPELCVEMVTVPTKTGETTACVTEDGRLLRGNVAATRARTNLRGYDSDGDGLDDGAWVVMASEESKGLGEDELGTDIDLGKNVFYYTFDMFEPEIVSQGLMLNQPAIYPDFAKTTIGDGAGLIWEPYPYAPAEEAQWFATIDPDPLYDPPGFESTLYQTEIARRASMLSQEADEAGGAGTVVLATWKEGIIQRGGPADVMARRFVLPPDFDPTTDNPFDYANMDCGLWDYTDGSNPRYVKGLCKAPPLNLSGTTIVTCTDANGADGVGEDECAATFPWNDNFDDMDMQQDEGAFIAWLTTWRMCQDQAQELQGVTCADTDLDDPTWENPFDLSKGHRGFLDGDFIMLLYAWSPNWKANKVGHDNYNFYVRRSFDGGTTWTTTPAARGGDGTSHCETYRDNDKSDPDSESTTLCFTYGAGEFEQARDISRFQSIHFTVLDPRYAPTADEIVQPDGFLAFDPPLPAGEYLYPSDERDHSKYVATYETGDNTTTAEGEPEPLDMFYGRASNWGDDYELFRKPDEVLPPLTLEECAPEDLLDPTNTCSFDALEHDHDYASSEATLAANPGGDFMYAVWSEWGEDETGHVYDSDIAFRRIMWFLDDTGSTDDDLDRFYDLSVTVSGSGSGAVSGSYLASQIIDCSASGGDCSETMAEGLAADLTATADFGSLFEGWQGDVVSTDNPLSVPMTEDRTLTAVFGPDFSVCTIDNLVVTDMLCTAEEALVACQSILIQGNSIVTGSGDLTLLAGASIAIDNGFVMEDGAQLEVGTDPSLIP